MQFLESNDCAAAVTATRTANREAQDLAVRKLVGKERRIADDFIAHRTVHVRRCSVKQIKILRYYYLKPT